MGGGRGAKGTSKAQRHRAASSTPRHELQVAVVAVSIAVAVTVFVSVSASVFVSVSHRCSKSEKSAVASSQLGLLKLAANRYTKRCVALRYNFEAASSLLASAVLFFFIFFFWDSAF